ncbi:MAG: DUF2249 domain-containing protein [Gemmatimonadota bacterium]
MVIRAGDRVATVLAADETLIDVFVSMSPAFERLRRPRMRRVMARLVTVEQAARMGGVDVETLLQRLNRHTRAAAAAQEGEVFVQEIRDSGVTTARAQAAEAAAEPVALRCIPVEQRVELDVRDELRAGREPFSVIMAALRTVPRGGAFGARAIFEPVPLYAVMRRQGLLHWTERLADDDWRVWFYPEDAATDAVAVLTATAAAAQHEVGPSTDDDVVILDVRGLEPPEPMLRTLAALEDLPAGATLEQLNVRVPQFLLPLLDERGFTYEVREQDADLVRLFIRRRSQ